MTDFAETHLNLAVSTLPAHNPLPQHNFILCVSQRLELKPTAEKSALSLKGGRVGVKIPYWCRYKVPNIKVPNHKIPNNKVPNNEIPK